MELGKQIKRYRMEENLSQEELADKVFVSRQTIELCAEGILDFATSLNISGI